MADETFETLFGSCVLELLTPDTSVSFPEGVPADDWLSSVKQTHAERKQAFFDEQLNLLLVMHINHPSLNNSPGPYHPPRSLVDFLCHIQISLEATYISQTPNQDALGTGGLVLPRTSSTLGKDRPSSLHPSIFPPNTPNPIPSTAEGDRKYVQSEGTLLFSCIWGTKKATEESKEKFALLFSETQKSWVAVYELSLIVSYLRLSFADPLLCLTASATLREKALSLSQSAHPLVAYLVRMSIVSDVASRAVLASDNAEEDEDDHDTGFEEINLLEGFTLGPTTSQESEPLNLPSTRLGNATRRRLFSLPPVSGQISTPPSMSKQAPIHILRKSYRKILQTVSGFRVRMRTVFVPHVLLPRNSSASETDQDAYDGDDFEDEREAGNSERTVILCVEVENSGESGPVVGFSLERLDVKIGGEGATTRLVGWGEGAFRTNTEERLFPLRIGSMEQYNLLYVVSFWNTPNDQENILLSGQCVDDGTELHRTVAITIYGRPYLTSEEKDKSNTLSYLTQTFSSRWNCILDLSPKHREEPVNFDETSIVGRNALPEPASPFPGRVTFSSHMSPARVKPTPQAIAGKRHTLPGSITAMRAINPTANLRLSLPSREQPGGSTGPVPTPGFTPPSVALQAFNRSPMSMFGTTPPPPEMSAQQFVTPPAPAYPAFPHVQALGSQQGYSGPSVDIKRERGMGMTSAVPQTALPIVLSAVDERQEPLSDPYGEPVVVSVSMLPAEDGGSSPFGQQRLYPSGPSSWTRRFEVCYPNGDRRQQKTEQGRVTEGFRGKSYLEGLKASIAPPGILPLQNRVRVGPLKPSTCQSVRMDFIAISPGVHSVDVLTLTDIETGYAVNLRSVMDIVVHERTVEREMQVP
ncbi:TRAPP trafficking subunit Trs65-domain-containing protein [Chiua virens]|nr:TRAPP trafficking subunit Trs65-domain-containing protein [Chiua virens]